MSEENGTMSLVPIGRVESRIVDRRLMPRNGAPARVEIYPEFEDGLLFVEENSHLWIVGWFFDADRDRLQIVRPEYEPRHRRRGVFGLRSTARPNPIGVKVGKLVERRDNILVFDRLDLLDGTPVIDIKRYSPITDSIFSARSSQDRYQDIGDLSSTEELELAAVLFHGRLSPPVIAGARLMQHLIQAWSVRPKDSDLLISIPNDIGQCGEIIDAIQGITGATIGTGRLRMVPGGTIEFRYRDQRMTARPMDISELEPDDVRQSDIGSLFSLL